MQAYTGGNGAQTVKDMNKAIGKRISEAAANIGRSRVAKMNQAIGKFVKRAAEDAATGKMHASAAARK
jgi:predicted transcriptional regulator